MHLYLFGNSAYSVQLLSQKSFDGSGIRVSQLF